MKETRREFTRLRTRWFWAVLPISFGVSLILTKLVFSSLAEVVGYAILLALVSTSLISILSIPVVLWMAQKRASAHVSSIRKSRTRIVE
jgi:ABC-type dipeptide/oligopeptide/nickel transport system permease component